MALALNTASFLFSSLMFGWATGKDQRNLASLSMSPDSSRVSHTAATWDTVKFNVGSAKIGLGIMGDGATGMGTLIPGDDDVSEWVPDPAPEHKPELKPRAMWLASVVAAILTVIIESYKSVTVNSHTTLITPTYRDIT